MICAAFIRESSCRLQLMIMLAAVALGAGTASALTSTGVDVDLDPAHSLFWRTVNGSSVSLSIDWPSEATSAVLSVNDNSGALPVRMEITRIDSDAGTVCEFEPVQPTVPWEERAYRAELVYYDKDGKSLSGETRTATFGAVLGHGNGAKAFVRNPNDRCWSRAVGDYVVLKVDEGVNAFGVDGQPVETGLDGAPGWYGARYDMGEHVVSVEDSPIGRFRVSGGMIMLFR